ncbi:MAG: SsrA-binding protein SmpB [Alphaproteobacteria bacterium]|nr:SsrA-binding protein SmpB [Alphaproteobacteria bacterium]
MARRAKRLRSAQDRFAAQNRKARRDYFIEDTIEAGLVLSGAEVKGLRSGGANLNDSYAREQGGELWLMNAHIPPYKYAPGGDQDSRRRRKLLLHRRELNRLIGAIQREGMTAVPLSIYFTDRGIAKVELGLAKGRRKFEKRELEKQRDWQRQKGRLMREKG